MQMEVTCRCGWTTRGTRSQVIANVREHGRTAHQQVLTAADVRAVWRTVEGDGAKR